MFEVKLISWHDIEILLDENPEVLDVTYGQARVDRPLEGRTEQALADSLVRQASVGASDGDIEELDLLARKRLKPLEKKYPTTARRFRRILALKRGEDGPGPVLTAVKSQTAQVCPLITVLT